VLPFRQGDKLECIVMGMATTPEANPSKRAYYGRSLINGLVQFLSKLAENNVTITKFYSTSATPTGIAILRNAHFKGIGQIGKRIVFELETMSSDAPLARRYLAALRKQGMNSAS